ncbi:HalOD1 output domain-containing protein [Candidatus Halobonum tyrrellensis]|uniref:Halobacterial output domain-containing protein n=1 Tax=Candidatus Halobonum tyrrellensis G22 TaxID=1324957 RepID=V4HC28_9EURY|nr:HalOD1 output domain-containing protein [Candidatus Halobonum tyrrellensis]ESP88260.1 hypothetical protein K933_09866 [Candidatus Halobonum tyrrellensis G22]
MDRPETDGDEDVAYRDFETEETTPDTAVVRTVAELEGVEASELPGLYSTIDHLLDHLFSDPPADDAQARVEFTYAGYRVAVNQDGRSSFRRVE